MGTLGHVCVDLGLRDASEGLRTGMQDVKYGDTGHGDVNDYCKSWKSMQYTGFLSS